MDLNEKELENVLGGANKEVVYDKVMENKEIYRQRSVEEIEKEIQKLKIQKEEILRNERIK